MSPTEIIETDELPIEGKKKLYDQVIVEMFRRVYKPDANVLPFTNNTIAISFCDPSALNHWMTGRMCSWNSMTRQNLKRFLSSDMHGINWYGMISEASRELAERRLCDDC